MNRKERQQRRARIAGKRIRQAILDEMPPVYVSPREFAWLVEHGVVTESKR